MSVPDQRDHDLTQTALTRWLTGRLPDARGVAVRMVDSPRTHGFASETLLFDADWDGRTQRLVAKVAPHRFQVFPDPMPYADQYRLLTILDKTTSIPVPPVHWYEPDAEILGAPFYVVGRVDGETPGDFPPYHQGGWVTKVSDATRGRMWWSGVEILADVHRLDAEAFAFLDRPAYGSTGLEQRLGYYGHYLRWAYEGPQPTAAMALEWLRENRPEEPDEPVLLWGDARIGNIIYRDGEAHAVLDWATATLGAPEEDLAWYLYLDRHHSQGLGLPRLPGFPPYEHTVRFYEAMYGRRMRHLAYYEVLSAFKFTVIMARMGQAFIDAEMLDPDCDFPYNNTASQLLAKLLHLPAPGPAPHAPYGTF
jgi:aminoglycoside phosphotransferase (APT) family kinase protein